MTKTFIETTKKKSISSQNTHSNAHSQNRSCTPYTSPPFSLPRVSHSHLPSPQCIVCTTLLLHTRFSDKRWQWEHEDDWFPSRASHSPREVSPCRSSKKWVKGNKKYQNYEYYLHGIDEIPDALTRLCRNSSSVWDPLDKGTTRINQIFHSREGEKWTRFWLTMKQNAKWHSNVLDEGIAVHC